MAYTYFAIKVVQTPNAEPFYLLQVRADQLLEWCDAPRKKEGFMAGYQRELSDRIQEIKAFIERDSKNIIPGAIVVAVGKGSVSVAPTAVPEVFLLTIDDKELDFADRLKGIAADFFARLDQEEADNANAMADRILAAPADDVISDDDDDEESDDSEDDIPPKSYLALLAAELKVASTSIDKLPLDRSKAVTDFVMG